MQAEKRIVERQRCTVEEYRKMGGADISGEDEYRRTGRAQRGEGLASEALPGLLVPVNDTLGG